MKVFAIGFKQHIELRKALTKPKEEVTIARVPPFTHQLYRTKLRLKVVHHRGGKVLKTVKGPYIGNLYVAEGQCVELPPEDAKRILKECGDA